MKKEKSRELYVSNEVLNKISNKLSNVLTSIYIVYADYSISDRIVFHIWDTVVHNKYPIPLIACYKK